MDTDKQFGRRLAAVVSAKIKASGMTQREVAALAGIPLVTLNGRLRGNTEFKANELHAIADVLSITGSALWDEAEQVAA